MTDFARTPDRNFDALSDFDFAPRYHQWQDLRMHYLDEGPAHGPVMLLLHGMPTWSYLYRSVIPPLVQAGYRCIVPDHMGFGRSDKPTDFHWYSIARHTEIMTSLIWELGLQRIALVCQDWAGPIGLAQAAMMPERFERLIIMNTWLHHEGFEYTKAIRTWARHWRENGLFAGENPEIAALLVAGAGHIDRDTMIKTFATGERPALEGEAAAMYAGYAAPFAGMDDTACNGLRRFPLSIPVDADHNGNAAAQYLHYRTLLNWDKPVNFVWGIEDDIFTEQWGRTWCSRMPNATFDPIEGAGHFLQNSHGPEVAERIIARAGVV